MRRWITLSADASFASHRKGWGIVARMNGERLEESGKIPGFIRTSTEAEFYSIAIGIELALERWPDATGITVECDCTGALEWIHGNIKESQYVARSIQAIVHERLGTIQIRTEWVRSHLPKHAEVNPSVKFNNKCDRMSRGERK